MPSQSVITPINQAAMVVVALIVSINILLAIKKSSEPIPIPSGESLESKKKKGESVSMNSKASMKEVDISKKHEVNMKDLKAISTNREHGPSHRKTRHQRLGTKELEKVKDKEKQVQLTFIEDDCEHLKASISEYDTDPSLCKSRYITLKSYSC